MDMYQLVCGTGPCVALYVIPEKQLYIIPTYYEKCFNLKHSQVSKKLTSSAKFSAPEKLLAWLRLNLPDKSYKTVSCLTLCKLETIEKMFPENAWIKSVKLEVNETFSSSSSSFQPVIKKPKVQDRYEQIVTEQTKQGLLAVFAPQWKADYMNQLEQQSIEWWSQYIKEEKMEEFKQKFIIQAGKK